MQKRRSLSEFFLCVVVLVGCCVACQSRGPKAVGKAFVSALLRGDRNSALNYFHPTADAIEYYVDRCKGITGKISRIVEAPDRWGDPHYKEVTVFGPFDCPDGRSIEHVFLYMSQYDNRWGIREVGCQCGY